MSYETSKANRRRVHDPLFARAFNGVGIDIGSGSDNLAREGCFPGIESCLSFDRTEGDINEIGRYIESCAFDFVYSSHCLEHLLDPAKSVREWFSLVKPGGFLVFVVPDEDLYEQGMWPSRFNGDHKWTFTIYKGVGLSWSPRSINVLSFVTDNLDGCTIHRISLEDAGYDYSLKCIDQTMHVDGAEANIEVVVQKR